MKNIFNNTHKRASEQLTSAHAKWNKIDGHNVLASCARRRLTANTGRVARAKACGGCAANLCGKLVAGLRVAWI